MSSEDHSIVVRKGHKPATARQSAAQERLLKYIRSINNIGTQVSASEFGCRLLAIYH